MKEKNKGGRPRKDASKNKENRVQIDMSDAQLADARRLAQLQGTSVSAAVAGAVPVALKISAAPHIMVDDVICQDIAIRSKQIVGPCIMRATITHNGYRGGDAGHGGFVTIQFVNQSSTDLKVAVNNSTYKEAEIVSIRFAGDAERDALIDALKMFLNELDGD